MRTFATDDQVAYWATRLPNDQFSFFTSTRLMKSPLAAWMPYRAGVRDRLVECLLQLDGAGENATVNDASKLPATASATAEAAGRFVAAVRPLYLSRS